MSSNLNHHLSNDMRRAMKMLGDDWILCIVGSLEEKELRFCEIERAVKGINPVTLTDRLKKLEKEKIVKRKVETLDRHSVVYELTKKGRAILPIIKEIGSFARKFL